MTKATLTKEIADLQAKLNQRAAQLQNSDPAFCHLSGLLVAKKEWLASLEDDDGDAKLPITKNGKAPKKVEAPQVPTEA